MLYVTRLVFGVVVAARLAVTCTGCEAYAISPEDKCIELFYGRSLAGCYTWPVDSSTSDPRGVFGVSDGMIHITGDGLGAIVTSGQYRDYHLVLEFKWGDRTWHERQDSARDSGLLIHSTGIDGGYKGIWMPAIEVQIIEGGVGDIVPVPGNDASGNSVPIEYSCEVARDRDGEPFWSEVAPLNVFQGKSLTRVNWFGRDPNWTDCRGVRGPVDADSQVGKWTRLDVICNGGCVEVFVNGVKVNEAFSVSPQYGRLQLQSELAEVFIRRWELWPLDKAPAPEHAK